MEILKLGGWWPVPVIFSNKLCMGYHGYCWWLFIAIRPDQADRCGLYAHELTHCIQMWRHMFVFYGILYMFYPEKRYQFELAAYRKQLKFTDESIEAAANDLAARYNINRTYEECLADLLIED